MEIQASAIFGHATLVLCLVLHLTLGYRRLRDIRYYSNDPLVLRTLGLSRLPDVATLSRGLASADAESAKRLQGLLPERVVTRLVALGLSRVTLDFDGSVIGTGKSAEGTAVGFNRKKKGQRSYYPLFCTIPQTGQALDVLHRSGNVHDSHGAKDFILYLLKALHPPAFAGAGYVIPVHPQLYRCHTGGLARGLYRGAHGQRLLQ